ncbi:GIY-YIG nuclease family protein [Propionicicella superfundia]|uniref:GIY-YIG nuclease family protein n=1 Tax=Propionicicella superfundia TaxID=348582 RepID=UPI00041FAFBD|nr:GIY-YIG nuclease family protein [Propionicicella superfundia]
MYILRCGDGSLYVGSTTDLNERLAQHAMGRGSVYTSRRLPVELVYAAEFASIAEAYALERKVHGWGRAKRLALIEGRHDELPALSRSRPRTDAAQPRRTDGP